MLPDIIYTKEGTHMAIEKRTLVQDKCRAIVERDKKVIAPCQHLSYFPLAIEKGKDAILTDADGNEYIDFLASASSLNLGSSNEKVTAALRAQLDKITQYAAPYTYNDPMVSYAERLASTFPGHKQEDIKVAFGNCGSDANDCAVKFARAYTGRTKIITFLNGYHGNTYGSSSMSTCTSRMRDKMGPFLPDMYHFPFYGIFEEQADGDYLKEMQAAFNSFLNPQEVAAVVIEPVQGDGGINPAHPEFMKQLYAICKENGILFISEEVQQGFYRDGTFWGIEQYPEIIPDGIIMGKSIGGGLTLGGFMAPKEIMDCLPAPAHLFTLGGNMFSCTAGLTAFDYYQSDEFQTILKANCQAMKDHMVDLKAKHPDTVMFTRGVGMSYGIAIGKKDAQGKFQPDNTGCFKTLFRSYEYGLLVISLCGYILRIQPPLNISKECFDKAFAIIDQALTDYENGDIPDSVMANQAGW